MLAATISTLTAITAVYPKGECNSGICSKFIPYQPVIKVSGKKVVVSTVSSCMVLFIRLSAYP